MGHTGAWNWQPERNGGEASKVIESENRLSCDFQAFSSLRKRKLVFEKYQARAIFEMSDLTIE